MKKNGFTLVELLAVIIVLSVILLIAAPKIQIVIESSRKSSIEQSTRALAVNAETIYADRKMMDRSYNVIEKPILCEEIANINNENYGLCGITFNSDGEAMVALEGKETFEDYLCTGTRNESECIKVPKETNFETDSWEVIKKVVEAGKIINRYDKLSNYKVGDTKCITLEGFTTTNDNECGPAGVAHNSFKVRIANNSHYDCKNEDGVELESKTACGFVVEFADIINTHKMNTEATNIGGWPETEMRAYIISDILPKLEESIGRNIILDTYVVSGHSKGDTSGILDNYNFGSTDKLYLLSTAEIWNGGNSWDTARSSSITRQLDFYNGAGIEGATKITTSVYASTYTNTPVKMLNSKAKDWWTRTARENGADNHLDNSFFKTNTSGGYTTDYASGFGGSWRDYGVSPAFRLG